ncbi:MAG: toprim domain-containing protein [Pseudolabrys sp.]|nr:toprim domain-containing protein [Pseudolabrys sp.]MCW5698060.1 toprim domain-containing protein [Bauldia sp.]
MARHDASELAQRLGRQAEAVCRHYLSAGHREGRYWLVGDVRNTPGRSMFVRLRGADSGKGAAGKWTDAATGEHGDLLDVIRESCGLIDFKDVADEARTFLSLPHPEPEPDRQRPAPAPTGSSEAARRLFAMSEPITGTVVESYLRKRGITALHGTGSLRFHPRCYYRPDEHSPTETWPAMIASVTNLDGRITGAHRTWLSSEGNDKAAIETPRRAMGDLLGHAVRFGIAHDCLAAGEGIETILSLRMAMPDLAVIAALSAAHLAAILFPATLRRLYIARDDDPAGDGARDSLVERAQAAGIETIVLSPVLGDFNEDLRTLGIGKLRAAIRQQIAPEDATRFLAVAA